MNKRDKLLKSIWSSMDKMGGKYVPGYEPAEFPIMTMDAWNSKLSSASMEELHRLDRVGKSIIETYSEDK